MFGTSCAEARPVAPALTQAACVAGAVVPPTLSVAQTDGITYAVDPAGPFGAGQSVSVTATLDAADVAWPATLSPGWEATSITTATYGVTFDDVSCRFATPVAPTVTQASCANGDIVPATIALPETLGLVYTLDPQGPYGPAGTDVLVTATLVEGFAWGEPGPMGFGGRAPLLTAQPVTLPAGWTLATPTSATYSVALEPAPNCAATGGESGTRPPTTDPVTEPGTGSDTGSDTGTAGAAPTPPPTPAVPTPAPPPPELAETGSTLVAAQLAAGALALAAGCLLVRLGNRRRPT